MSRKNVFSGKTLIKASDFLDATDTDWYLLGVYLELPHEQLSDIERRFSHHGHKRCKIELFDLWVRTTSDASWEQIALALDKCGEQVLAEEVRKNHPPPPLPSVEEQEIQDDGEATVLAIKVEEETVKEFRKVERKFAILACDIQTAIEEGNISLVRLQRFLREILKENGKFMQATTVEELFDKIRPHYCFLNTTILEDIVEEFFGEPLKEQLDTYEKQLNEFIESTKVSFLEKIDSKRTSDEAEMPQIVFKMSSRLADITIERFQKLVRLIFEEEERALTHALVKKGCICITWLTRESAIPSLLDHAQRKVEFMSLVGILRLSITKNNILDRKDYDDTSLQEALLLATNAGCADAVEFLHSLRADPKPTPQLQPTVTPQHTERTKTRLAINIKARCGSPIGEGIPAVYQLPLQQVMVDSSSQIVTYRFKFDQSTSSQEAAAGVAKLVDTSVESTPKVLMLVGATGAGKTTLINGMANYILGVSWEDNFRFNLTSKHSQSSWIIAYTFPKMDNSPLSHPLTVVDTPGFEGTDGVERNKRIAAQMKKFFSLPPPNSIDHINAIGLVAPASLSHLTPSQQYMYQSILAMFGKDLGGNIVLMATFANGGRPPLLDAMKQAGISCVDTFKFNNSALYEKSDKNFWDMSIKNFRAALDSIHHVEPKSLQLTRDVLHKREHLETTLKGLDTKIKDTMRKVDELQQEQQILQQHQRDVDVNKDFTYSVTVDRIRKVSFSHGEHANVCRNCFYTCHYPCSVSSDSLYQCAAMSEGKCTVCPRRCEWHDHELQSYRIEMYEETEQRTYESLKHRYDEAKSAMSATEKILNDLEEELRKLRDALFDIVRGAQTSLNQLKEISLKPDPLLDEQKIELLVESEKQQMAPGWEQRIDDLKAAQKKAQLLVKAGEAQSSDPQWWESFRM